MRNTSCVTGKARYRTQTAAENVLARIWAKPRPGRRLETRTYQCDHCAGWHLTSKPRDHRSAA